MGDGGDQLRFKFQRSDTRDSPTGKMIIHPHSLLLLLFLPLHSYNPHPHLFSVATPTFIQFSRTVFSSLLSPQGSAITCAVSADERLRFNLLVYWSHLSSQNYSMSLQACTQPPTPPPHLPILSAAVKATLSNTRAQWEANMCHVLASLRRRVRSISVPTNGGVQTAFDSGDLSLRVCTHTRAHTHAEPENGPAIPVWQEKG